MDRRAFIILCILLAGCRGSQRPAVQDLANGADLSLFKLQVLRGTRDGDRLAAQAMFSDTSSILTVELHFAIGSPTTLQSGTWKWSRSGNLQTGSVAARSVTFLGGQDGPPSIGGSFDLLGANGAQYRVNIPLTELRQRWPG
jgi:hypothetical protein